MKIDTLLSSSSGRKLRIFWFGAHKLLVRTELARLRQLGYEVFNPPYLAHILDQSAVTEWDHAQQSTLPPDVFQTLAGYNFFYETIEPQIVEILNHYFDGVVVTIASRWVTEILRVFDGPIWFRTYGQTLSLSDELTRSGARPFIEGRDDFVFSPHCEETAADESPWLRDRARVVPYCLTSDVFSTRNTWRGGGGDIIISAPNILGNPFHRVHYDFLKEYFYQEYFHFLGVQPLGRPEDPQVIGTLTRDEQLEKFRHASGYLYTYRDPRVCYLPPVEMIILGGPVIYLAGSLLARYIGASGPGEARTIKIAHEKCAQLRRGTDALFVREILEAQKSVADRYDPERVWLAFDAAAGDTLRKKAQRPVGDSLTPMFFPEASQQWRALRRVSAQVLLQVGAPSENDESDIALDSIIEPVRPLIAGDGEMTGAMACLSRRQFLAEPFRSLVGETVIDPVLGDPARYTPASTAGFLHFGPYIPLEPGRYQVTYLLRAAAEHEDVAAIIDVCVKEKTIASSEISARQGVRQSISLTFDVVATDGSFEFRVLSTGVAEVFLYEISLVRVSRLAPIGGGDGEFLSVEYYHVGRWTRDPELERLARFAPKGTTGYIQFGPYCRLEPGAYQVSFALRGGSAHPEVAAHLDVVSGENIFAQSDWRAEDRNLAIISCLFSLQDPGDCFEFRVKTFGVIDVFLYSVTLKKSVPMKARGASDRSRQEFLLYSPPEPRLG